MKVNVWRGVMVSAMAFAELQEKEQRKLVPKIRERLLPLQKQMRKAKVTAKDKWLLLIIPQEQDKQSPIFGVALVQHGIFPQPTRVAGFVFNDCWGVLRQAADVESDALVKNEMRPVLERVIQRVVLQDREVLDAILSVHVALPQFRSDTLQVVK